MHTYNMQIRCTNNNGWRHVALKQQRRKNKWEILKTPVRQRDANSE